MQPSIRDLVTIVEHSNGEFSPAFRTWFGSSKVVDQNGQPLICYHGSMTDFTSFRGGSHFGDIAAANRRIEDKTSEQAGITRLVTSKDNKGTVYPVYLRIKNPLEIIDDKMLQTGHDLTDAVEKTSTFTAEEIDSVRGMHFDSARKVLNRLFDLLENHGYDGMTYMNTCEGTGRSWIVMGPYQVKSIYNSGSFHSDREHMSEAEDAQREHDDQGDEKSGDKRSA